MKSIDLDREDEHVKNFLRTLAHDAEETILRLNGQPLLKVLPPYGMSDAEKKALIEERKTLMRQARERTKEVPAGVIESEIDDAISEVRGGRGRQIAYAPFVVCRSMVVVAPLPRAMQDRLEDSREIALCYSHMTDVRYEPLPPTVVYQRITREGRLVVYFVPADTQAGDFEAGILPVAKQQTDPLSAPSVPARVA